MKTSFRIILLIFIIAVFTATRSRRALVSTEDRWDDIVRVSAQATRINPALTKPDFGTFLGNTMTYLFDPDTDECVNFSAQIPHKWKLGSDLEPHIHWTPTSTNTGNVIWNIEYTIAAPLDTFGATATLPVTDPGDGTAYKHQIADFAMIDMSSYTAVGDVSIMLIIRLCRDADNLSDTYTGDAAFLEFDIHGLVDDFGSQEEYSK